MIIRELPEDIKLIALQRQQEQGNKPNENHNLSCGKSGGNFDWDNTPESNSIWSNVHYGQYNAFYVFHKAKEFTFNFDLI